MDKKEWSWWSLLSALAFLSLIGFVIFLPINPKLPHSSVNEPSSTKYSVISSEDIDIPISQDDSPVSVFLSIADGDKKLCKLHAYALGRLEGGKIYFKPIQLLCGMETEPVDGDMFTTEIMNKNIVLIKDSRSKLIPIFRLKKNTELHAWIKYSGK